MKSLWNALAIIALTNVVGISGFVGWLVSSGRLDRGRLDAIREMLSETVDDEKRRLAEDERAKAQSQIEKAAMQRLQGTPESALDRIETVTGEVEVTRQEANRLRAEIAILQRTLLDERRHLDEQIALHRQERAAFDEHRTRLAEIEGSVQFKTALATLQGQKPRDAYLVLKSLMDQRMLDEVVSYLNAMDERQRTKVVAEFVRSAPEVAADLLERLRTKGLDPPRPEDPAP